jgi:hypothetical protein
MKNWTEKFPTRPGWYWTKTPHGDERLFEVVPVPRGVFRPDAKGNPVRPEVEGLALRIAPDDAHPYSLDHDIFEDWEWSGPVDPPEARS